MTVPTYAHKLTKNVFMQNHVFVCEIMSLFQNDNPNVRTYAYKKYFHAKTCCFMLNYVVTPKWPPQSTHIGLHKMFLCKDTSCYAKICPYSKMTAPTYAHRLTTNVFIRKYNLSMPKYVFIPKWLSQGIHIGLQKICLRDFGSFLAKYVLTPKWPPQRTHIG